MRAEYEAVRQAMQTALNDEGALQVEQLKQDRYAMIRDTHDEAHIMKENMKAETEEIRLQAYLYYNNLIVTAEND
eukprot:12357483-Heterocapsa_arctica.AAC.1